MLTKLIKSAIVLILSVSTAMLSAQERLFQEGFWDIKEGVYRLKSLDKGFTSSQKIDPQLHLPDTGSFALLVPKGQKVTLFKTSTPKSQADIAGYLDETSVVEHIGTHYQNTFKDSSRKFYITHEVWTKIKINGTAYYTDYKLHTSVFMERKLEQWNQTFLVMAQYDGYDEYYDVGYPEYLRVLFLDDDQRVIYQSDELPVVCNCEFGVQPDELEYYVKSTPDTFEFKIPGFEYDPETKVEKNYVYIGRWNGRELNGKLVDNK